MNIACNCKRRMVQSHKCIFLGNYASMNKSHFVETSFRLSLSLSLSFPLIWPILLLFLSAFALFFCSSYSPLFFPSSQFSQFASFPNFPIHFMPCRHHLQRGCFFPLCERYTTLALVVYAVLSKPLKLFFPSYIPDLNYSCIFLRCFIFSFFFAIVAIVVILKLLTIPFK